MTAARSSTGPASVAAAPVAPAPVTPAPVAPAPVASVPAPPPGGRPRVERSARLACAVGAVLALVPVAVLGDPFAGAGSGAQVTARLVENAGRAEVAALLAVAAGALLLLASVRAGARLGGAAGRTATVAGAAVALGTTAYYGAFAAGAVVATRLLPDHGPGLGEATLVVANVVEMTRFAPGAALAAAVLVAGSAVPRALRVGAGVLLVVTVLPFTGWAAALVLPAWLGTLGTLRLRPGVA